MPTAASTSSSTSPSSTSLPSCNCTSGTTTPPANRDRIWGLFGTSDTLAHYEPLFLEHYTHAFHFPGAHTPTPDEVLRYYVPLVVQLIDRYATR